ncbi:hypothetical protein SAMN03159297_05577, partial [Pseudomonas sp. NFACC45]
MVKPTPNPPKTDSQPAHKTLDAKKLDKAAQKALDHYLKPDTPEKPARQLDYFIV